MKNRDWQRTEDLFHAAMALAGEERAAYLAQACQEDASLVSEVESLIAAFENQDGLFEQPAFNLGLQVWGEELEREDLAGKQIGPYKVLALLGRGGMGEVYLATDEVLNRKVALKFLSNKFTDDAWAKRQLMKEAQAIARLDHPNICAVHGFEEHDGHSFIVMRYVEGETLASIIKLGLLEPEQTSHLAIQIVRALEEAHSHGIVHRDIKPQNIIVAANGQLNVLDFGLAKLVQQRQDAPGPVLSDSHSSQLGLVLGTVAYMSPEQLRAERLDFRSDLFSFGIVLYEMISGRNPYARGSNAEIISAILTSDPPPLPHLSTPVSAGLERIAQKCLKRDKEQRYQSASELLLDLDKPSGEINSRSGRRAYLNVRWRIALALLALLVIGVSVMYWRATRPRTLAVLPIVNKSADANAELLSKGLTEGISNRLSRLSRLRVKLPTVVPDYEDENAARQRVGNDFNVDTALFGTLTSEKGSVVLEVTLVNAADGSAMWHDRYTVAPGALLSLQADLAFSLASNIKPSLSEDEKRLLFIRPTENEEAHKNYIYGRHFWNDRNKENIKEAIRYFELAVKADPAYAKAYSGLADSYVLLSAVTFGRPMSTREAMNNAKWAAKKALEIDDSLPEAHTSMGIYTLKYEWDWQGAEREFKRAIELNSEYPPAHFWYSSLLGLCGRWQESISEGEIARDLEPFAPPSIMNLGRAYYYSRQYDRAIDYCLKNLEKNPDHLSTLNVLGLAYLQKGMLKESTEVFQKLYAADQFYGAAPLGLAYAKAGRRSEALEILNALSKQADVPVQEKAIIQIGLGNQGEAFALLKHACEDRFATFPFLLMEPFLDGLRSDPGFLELIECAHLSDINNHLRATRY